MKKIIYKAKDRGYANHGWLKSYHTFSFAGYYNPEKMRFGALRVLNDDVVEGGMGFGKHPHDNMEIISIPLSGALEHKDNTGREAVIRTNEVQMMSAGTGIMHSEFNASKTEAVNFLQIWVLPKERNITPRYQQLWFDPANRVNQWQIVVAPDAKDKALQINQDAWFSLGNFDAGQTVELQPKQAGQGSYLMLLEGEAEVAGEKLEHRDAIALADFDTAKINVLKAAKFLLIDVPMN